MYLYMPSALREKKRRKAPWGKRVLLKRSQSVMILIEQSVRGGLGRDLPDGKGRYSTLNTTAASL